MNSDKLTPFQMFRVKVANWIDSPKIQNIIISVIVINAITLGLETSETVMDNIGGFLLIFDKIVLGIFVIEILLKLFGFGFRFFKVGWNVFDFIIVAIALMPASGALSVLRSLRILRALRLLKAIPRLRKIVDALARAIPDLSWIFLLVILFFYVYAVMATKLFGQAFPEYFGSIGASMFTLFQTMTLESWASAIARPVMEQFPIASLFFVSFIVIATIVILNVIVGVMVTGLQEAAQEESAKVTEEIESYIVGEKVEIVNEIRRLSMKLDLLEKKLSVKNE